MKEIRQKDADIQAFSRRILSDTLLRDEIILQMLENRDIMVYYHCFYILEKAAERQPSLFYPRWDDFSGLLAHENSYHRDFGLTLTASLVPADREGRIDGLLPDYLRHVNDVKFMTAQCCVRNLCRIVRFRADMGREISEFLMQSGSLCSYPEKQRELLKSDILEVLEQVFENGAGKDLKDRIRSWALGTSGSISPKTRRAAAGMFKRIGPS